VSSKLAGILSQLQLDKYLLGLKVRVRVRVRVRDTS